jgi:hypothetical protein
MVKVNVRWLQVAKEVREFDYLLLITGWEEKHHIFSLLSSNTTFSCMQTALTIFQFSSQIRLPSPILNSVPSRQSCQGSP